MSKKSILVVAGCIVSGTPVVGAYLQYLSDADMDFDVVEYKPGRRFYFVIESLKKTFFGGYEQVVFVNFQSLPILFLSLFTRVKKKVYWKLESNTAFENRSLALKLQLLEWCIPRKTTTLVVPTAGRAEVQRPSFGSTYVLANAPLMPYRQKLLPNCGASTASDLVMYGNLEKSSDLYVDEWIKFVAENYALRITLYRQGWGQR